MIAPLVLVLVLALLAFRLDLLEVFVLRFDRLVVVLVLTFVVAACSPEQDTKTSDELTKTRAIIFFILKKKDIRHWIL